MIPSTKPFMAGLAILLCCLWTAPIAAQAAEDEPAAEEPQGEIAEIIVVTASRAEQSLHHAPVAVTVLTAEELEAIPADDYGDYLRNVPGINVAQMSARDVQITGRQAATSVATSELVLIDGRTIYQDFYGFVGWDMASIDPLEIKQIEVVRGPGSAVWGANAMSGVINLITKAPREMVGTNLVLGGGELGTLYGRVLHAGVKDRFGYRVSGSYYEQDPYDRPTGLVPGTQTPYPPFANDGTEQTKVNLRLDFDQSDDATWSFEAGYGGTGGMLHTGMGPFDMEDGSSMRHAKVDWIRRSLHVGFFANFLEGDSVNLLTVGADGRPLLFTVETDTYNLDLSNTSVLGENHILTYGLNLRSLDFDLNIAPAGDSRDEKGVFLQDEMLFGDKVRWLVGARWDDIDPIDPVVSPRTSLLVSPRPGHTFRLSYGRAFRAPSLLNHYMDSAIVNFVELPIGPYAFPTATLGNLDLQEERLDAFELGYVGDLGKNITLSFSVYRNEIEDYIDFYPATFYTSANPPPGWPLPPALLDVPPPFGVAGLFPASFSFRNIGKIVDEGFEASLRVRPTPACSLFVTYSIQEPPDAEGISEAELNTPPRVRINVGTSYSGAKYFISGNVNYVDDAFWTDVLDSRFWGPTDDYFQVNLGVGMRFADELVTLSLNAQNLLDEDIQQHVFGDIISRKVSAEVRFRF